MINTPSNCAENDNKPGNWGEWYKADAVLGFRSTFHKGMIWLANRSLRNKSILRSFADAQPDVIVAYCGLPLISSSGDRRQNRRWSPMNLRNAISTPVANTPAKISALNFQHIEHIASIAPTMIVTVCWDIQRLQRLSYSSTAAGLRTWTRADVYSRPDPLLLALDRHDGPNYTCKTSEKSFLILFG